MIKSVQKAREGLKYRIDPDKCVKCKSCLKIGCPSVILKEGVISIDRDGCNGCSLCSQMCKLGAIEREEN